MATQREIRLLELCKRMFKHYTGEDVQFAQEIISIEDEITATSEKKPDTKEPIQEQKKEVIEASDLKSKILPNPKIDNNEPLF